MSGARPAGTNVVPMPTAASAPQGQMMMPSPMMWSGGGFPAGCCPPGNMDALMKCYCDVQAALQFFSKVMVDLMTNDPAVQAAMITGIENSGSNVPLIGVTNGSNAQPGQVGEYIQFDLQLSYPAASNNMQIVSAGVLPPGDWDCWAYINFSTEFTSASFQLMPQPAGMGFMQAAFASSGGTPGYDTLIGPTVQALTTVPELMAFQITTNATAPGSMRFVFDARRRR